MFAYVDAEKAVVYRRVMRAFMLARDRFRLHLRPAEVVEALRLDGGEPVELGEVESALRQLSQPEWGNLAAHPDTADVATVEEFYRPRFLFQLSAEGGGGGESHLLVRAGAAAARRAADRGAEGHPRPPGPAGSPGGGGRPRRRQDQHGLLRAPGTGFHSLADRAQAFMASLQRSIDLHGLELQQFLQYKERLIDYLERFIGELVIATSEISELIERIEAHGVDRLLEAAAQRELVDRLSPTDDERAQVRGEWARRWEGLRTWFVPRGHQRAQAEVLRASARAAIPQLLAALSGIHDRRVTRTDRAQDFRTLARWFAECRDDGDAHRLFRAAFGLAPSRHLSVDAETLEAREQRPVPATSSWLSAPPLLISPRLRATGRTTRPGRAASVIDRTEAKAKLARLAQEDALRSGAAEARFATGAPFRLSSLSRLSRSELDLLLDILGDALGAAGRHGGWPFRGLLLRRHPLDPAGAARAGRRRGLHRDGGRHPDVTGLHRHGAPRGPAQRGARAEEGHRMSRAERAPAAPDQHRDERRRALRALLLRPLITSGGAGAESLPLVRRHAQHLREWLRRKRRLGRSRSSRTWCGCGRSRGTSSTGRGARWTRRPGSPSPAAAMPCCAWPSRRWSAPNGRPRWGSWAEEVHQAPPRGSGLGRARAGLGLLRAGCPEGPGTRGAGSSSDWVSLRHVHGDEQQFLHQQGDVLYAVQRSALVLMLSARRPPSMIEASSLEDRLRALTEDPAPSSDEARNRRIRVALTRRLLDDPAVVQEDLGPEERAYLVSQRAHLARQIEEATGLVAEVREEGLAMVDEGGRLTDVGLPEEGTEGHLALLMAELLARRARQQPGVVVPRAELVTQVASLVARHGEHWRKDARAPGAEERLTDGTLSRLHALGLVRLVPEGVVPRPAIGRYALASPRRQAPAQGSLDGGPGASARNGSSPP